MDSGHVLASFMTSLAQVMSNASTPHMMLPSRTATAVPSTPVTPTRPHTDVFDSSPVPSPTQIPRYLAYAEAKLGIANAKKLAPEFISKGWGPDILTSVPLSDIKEKVSAVGGTEGDALRLQINSTKWWKGPDAKRKRRDTQTDIDNLVQYEREEPDGTMRSWPGNPPKRGRTKLMDKCTTYLDDRIGYRIPIPDGWTTGEPKDGDGPRGRDGEEPCESGDES